MAVKRKRVSPNHQSDEKIRDGNIRSCGTSIGDITQVLFFDILMRLPTKSIILCKSVCKEWYNLIWDPEFAKFHSAQAKPQFFIRASDCTRVSRTLYLVEPEQHSQIFDLDNCTSNQRRNCRIELSSIMKIPLNNADCVLPVDGQDNPEFDAKTERTCLELKPRDHMFKVANSCHGLLCLSEPLRNDPVSVCNPLTGEYINLPKTKNIHPDSYVDCGLGFSPKSNTYKVIRVGIARLDGELKTYRNTFAEVHTLGTVSWRSVDMAPYSTIKLANPTYHDGSLYCLYAGDAACDRIISFSFDDERFRPVPPPLCGCDLKSRNVSLGVLRGDLCICDASNFKDMDIWAMKNNKSSGKSWTKLFSVRECVSQWPLSTQPVTYFENGASLMFRSFNNKLIYSNQEGSKHKYFSVHGLLSRYQVIAYTPSFIRLKDIHVADYSEVLNVNSRCTGKLKLPGETQAIYLNEDVRGSDTWAWNWIQDFCEKEEAWNFMLR